MSSYSLAHVVLVVTAAVLFYAAWNDLRHYKIRNELVIVLAVLFVVYSILSGHWREIHWNFLVAFFIFIVLMFFYVRKGIGGGDIKLLTVCYLWVGYTCMLPFTILLLLFSLIVAIVSKMGLVKSLMSDHKRIPFAPAIAAALIGTFMLGCLERPATYSGANDSNSGPVQNSQNGQKVSPPQSK